MRWLALLAVLVVHPAKGEIMAYDLQIGAATLFMETSAESEEGQKAVAHTMINRLKAGRFGRTLSEVCLRYRQFSGWNDKDPNGIRFAVAPDSLMGHFEDHIQAALAGKEPDPTGGALYYYNPRLASPKWDFGKLEKTAEIGNHVFYREKRQKVASK